MDSHQVEGQRRCTSARSKRLPWVKTAVGRALSPKGSFPARPRIRSLGHLLSFEIGGPMTGTDWLPTFEFGLANDSSCLTRPVRVYRAAGRLTLKLDARESSSRWQPPALNVDRPTAAFEASELSLSTHCGRPSLGMGRRKAAIDGTLIAPLQNGSEGRAVFV